MWRSFTPRNLQATSHDSSGSGRHGPLAGPSGFVSHLVGRTVKARRCRAGTVARVRAVFAHEAVLAMGSEQDLQAPGGAITLALCGSWEHAPPCPLAPHHTTAGRDGDAVRLRVLFAAEPGHEPEVRRRIAHALAAGRVLTPGGGVARWSVASQGPGEVRPEESEHGRRLAAN
jgi:hypothetical protein